MRAVVITIVSLILTACGGGSPTDAPPVIVTPVPAVVSVTAGDGQQAVPGATLPVKPVVTVKDAAGRPTAGVTVTFAVDSGGGTLQASSATTAADGTASPGDWKLGPNEARNVLRVTVGTLPPVKILALGFVAPVTIADQTVGSGGGTIAVTTAGSPIDGLRIVVPAGAFAGGQTVGIAYGSALGVTLPAGVRILSPLVTFRTSDGGIAASPMQITIPASVPTGSQPAILLRDAASGRQEIMTTVAWSATSVTGMSAHLNGALLMGADGSVAARSSARREAPAFAVAGGTGTAVVITLPEEMLALDHDTGFRPGVDSWEFRPIGTVAATNIQSGMIASEAWYYIAKKGSSGSLWKKYQEAEGIEESNRRGLRWASVAQGEVGAQVSDGFLAVLRVSWSLPLTGARPLFTAGNFNSVRGALTLSPGSPQPAILASFDEAVAPVMILVYRSTGKKLFAVDPDAPDQTVVLDFSSSSGSMTPVRLSGGGPAYTNFVGAGFSLLAAMAPLQAEWAAVADGTIGNGIFPTYQPKIGWGATAAETANLADPVFVFGAPDRVDVWADCVTCIGEPRPATFAPGAAQVARFLGYQRAAAPAPWLSLGSGTRLGASETNDFGLAIFAKRTPTSTFEWADWKSFTARRLPATLAPTAPTADPNTDVALALTVTGAPGNLEYVWDFADGTPLTTTAVANATHQWSTSGAYSVKVTARDKTTKQPVAKASTDVTITGGILAWKFTTLDVAFSTEGPNVNSDGKWLQDSTRFLRMRNGGSQGGIRLVERAFTPGGSPLRTAAEGLYILEGASLTGATANYPLNNNIFASVQFAGAPLTLDAAPKVYGWEAVRALQITPEPTCKDPSESFVRTGSATSGRVAGLTVQYCWDRFNPPQPGFEYLVGPRITIATDVTFSGTTATGTITLTYLFQQPSRVTQKKIATVTFTATQL